MNNDEDEIQQELKYRLILARYSEDDPLTEAYLLEKLKETYEKYNVKISANMKEHFETEAKRIYNELMPVYEKKKAEFEKGKTGTKSIVHEKKESIFSNEDIAKF